MVKYTSQYPALMFYVNDELKRFSNGEYNTDDKDEITVLDALIDAKRVDEPKVTPPKAETKSEAKPATKAPAKAKASAK